MCACSSKVLLFVYVETPVMFIILEERSKDKVAIEFLLDDVFGATRHDKASYAFRVESHPVPGLSFSAHCGERLVGTIRFWLISLGHKKTPALLMGPLGVAPDMRGYGVGRNLIFQGHIKAAEMGHELVLLVGAKAYYSRFGYVPARPHGLVMPGEDPTRLLVCELRKNALKDASGTLQGGEHPQPCVIGSKIVNQASY